MGYKKHRQELKNRDREPDRRKLWWVRIMRNKNKSKEHLPPTPLFFWAHLHS